MDIQEKKDVIIILYASIDKKKTKRLVLALLDWYEKNKRDLPWRRIKNPYAVWVSEIMAQQTKIATVIPYYNRFMELFPTVEALATAHGDDVLKAWEGLGYYSRAKNLQKAAQKVVSEFDGKIPSTMKQIISLPGIGEYTAGAILSICFGQAVPAVDGNVLRVFARLENNEMDISLPVTKTMLTAYISELIPKNRAGDFTQAVMELGALICIPKNPVCESCPVSAFCKASALGRQQLLPVKSAKLAPKHITKTILLIQGSNDRLLMRQRTEKLLNGLWEFYAVEEQWERADVKKYIETLGVNSENIFSIGKINHTFTHMVWEMEGFFCDVGEMPTPEGYTWILKDQIKSLAIPTAMQFFVQYIMGERDVQIQL